MFDHVNFDVLDLAKSTDFYNKALATLGHSKVAEYKEYGVVGFGTKRPQFWIVKGEPHAQPAEIHVCFAAHSRKQVDNFYAAAIAAGGKDNGRPGIRKEYHSNYYGAFVLDPDGYNVEAVCHSPE